jgi:hypothetical protein
MKAVMAIRKLVSRYDMKSVVLQQSIGKPVRHFSLKRNSVADKACSLLLAMTFTMSPLAALAQGEGSLDDMWSENQTEVAKPAAAPEETEKPVKKSSRRSSKKPKTETPPKQEDDLLKSTDKPAPGWDSPSTSSPSSSPSGSDSDLKKSSDTTDSSSNTTPIDTTSTGSETSKSSTPPTSSVQSTEVAAPASSRSSSSTAKTPASKPSKGGSGTSKSSSPSTARTSAPAPATTASDSSDSNDTTAASSTSTTESSNTETALSKPNGPMQPLCKLASIKSSDLVKSGGWPGVGPFAQDQGDSNALIDESKNKLKLKLSGEDVTHAELLLVNQSPKPSQLLALQMTADFLLEAVGAQPGKIADFNNDMMKNQEKLSGGASAGSVNLKAGTYVVQIQRKAAQESTVPGNVSYLIALDNQKPAIVASASTPKTDGTSFSVYSTPSPQDNHDSQSTSTALSTPIKTTTPVKTTTTPVTTPTATPKNDDLLHKQFANLINSWQQMKRAAVKTRQSASLSRILGGNALATQNRAIEWLIENKRYYEMTPLELKVQSYKEISPGSKYEIETFIKERRQLVSADTMKVEKDNTQAYNVVYTVEKIRGAWLITDTRMVKPQ